MLLPLLLGQGVSGGTAYTLTGLAGSYSLSGGSATLSVGRKITGNAGSYSLTGGTASLRVGRRITGNAGSYSLTGSSATLTKTSGPVAYALTGLAGAYSLSGGSATLKAGRSLSALAGAYALTGSSATLTKTSGATAYTLTGLPGSYAITGGDAVLELSIAKGGGAGDYGTKRRYVVKVGDKLIAFANKRDALQALKAQDKPEKAKTAAKPVQQVSLDAVRELAAERQALEYFQAQLAQLRYEALLRDYEQWREEQDIEDLLAIL